MFVDIITCFAENTRDLQKVLFFLRKLCKSYPQFQKKLEDTVENQPKFSQNTGFYLVENRDGLFWIKRKTPVRRFGNLERTRIEATFIFGDIRDCCQVFCKDNWGLVFCIQKNNKITLTTCPVLTFICLSKETVFYKQTCNKKADQPACLFNTDQQSKCFAFSKSSQICSDGAGVMRETTTINTQEIKNAGSNS